MDPIRGKSITQHYTSNSNTMTLSLPVEFDFTENLIYLNRSPWECLHYIDQNHLYKLLLGVEQEKVLLKIKYAENHTLEIIFLNKTPSLMTQELIMTYILDWFDLGTDLSQFYRFASKNELLSSLVQSSYGLRLIGIPDLFEAITWAVIGQQINLQYAYQLKKEFVKLAGKYFEFKDRLFWLFPTPNDVAQLSVDDLRKIKFTKNKAEYVLGIANQFVQGHISKRALRDLNNVDHVHETLLNLRGVGPWTASYVEMKCLRYPTAFPITDVGLHNALKFHLGLKRKPTLEEISNLSSKWEGWESYVTFYLWRSLQS